MPLNIENNHHHIGKAYINVGNVKKFMTAIVLSFVVLTTSGCQMQEEKVAITTEYDDTDSYEPRYNNIEYKVKWGDTLSEIVASYEDDYNRILSYVDIIEMDNNIKGVLEAGSTIKLSGVPESKLVDFGYTSDYSIIGYDVKVKDAYNWLIEEKQWIVKNDRNKESVDQFNEDFMEFIIQYNAYLTEENENDKQQMLDELVKTLDNVLEQFKDISGLDFNLHHNAYPIQEIQEYKNIM